MRKVMMLGAVVSMVLAACGNSQVDVEAPLTSSPTISERPATTATSATSTTANLDTPAADLPPIRGVLLSFETAPAEIRAARIEGSMEFEGMTSQVGASSGMIRFGTAFNEATGDSSFLMDMSALADTVSEEEDPLGLASGFFGETEFRSIGDRVYVKFPFVTALLGADTAWVSMPEEDGDEFTTDSSDVPSDPREVLDAYADAGGTIENLGLERVNGVEATHYRILLDADAMRLSAEERAELEASGLFAAGDIPMDVWFTQDGHMVKLVLEFDGTGSEMSTDREFERMILRYDVFDINGDVRIEPPPAEQVTAIEDLDPFGVDG